MTHPPQTQAQKREAHELPSVFDHLDELLTGKKPAIFLDYDGCLSPIVKQPELAVLTPAMRDVLKQLSEVCTVAVVSGRDRQNVQELVQLESLYFAGSHGFDIVGPGGLQTEPGGATEALPALDEADELLKERLQHVKGARVERKRYAIAVHYRNVTDEKVAEVEQAVQQAVKDYPQLKIGLGKKIFELKPNMDWHKGKAVLWLLDELQLNTPDILPVYIGDDITDEDAFAALQGRGVGILVGEHDELTAAEYKLENVDEVRTFLQKLTDKISKAAGGKL